MSLDLTLRRYRPGDEHFVTPRADFAAAYAGEGRLPIGPKWTVERGDNVLAVGGFEPLGGASWCAWAYAADLAPREWVTAGRGARSAIDWLAGAMAPLEVWALAHAHPGADRLLRRIGFLPAEAPGEYLLSESA